jgi:RimJ/RimL family protein N-acetyltransferase
MLAASVLPALEFREMSSQEREAFLERTFRAYRRDIARFRGLPLGSARALTARERRRLLPDGGATPDHRFWWLVDPTRGRRVGELGVGLRRYPPRVEAWVYDVRIDPAHRRRGCGAAAFRRLEANVRALGAHTLGLNVFARNTGARALYDRLGFEPRAVVMTKSLRSARARGAPSPPSSRGRSGP